MTRNEQQHQKEQNGTPRELVCSNGTIVTEHATGALAGRLHLESTSGETVLVMAAELLQFLSDYDMERQLAGVSAERDALKQRVGELEAEVRHGSQTRTRKDKNLIEIRELTGINVVTMASLAVRFDARAIEIVADLCRRAQETAYQAAKAELDALKRRLGAATAGPGEHA